MSEIISVNRLAKVKSRGQKTIAQCPACAAGGGDKSGEHLVIFADGAFGCVQHPGDKAHLREIITLVGNDRPRPVWRSAPPPRAELKRPPFTLPTLRVPTVGELDQIARVRGLPFFAGLELASRAGHLRMATLKDGDEIVLAWLLTDSAQRNAQARRLDGVPWRAIGGVKAKTLAGAQAAWPLGSADIGAKPFVALCEGGPDTLAAWSIAWWNGMAGEIAPCCMAGSHPIHEDALPLFHGKGVFLVPHRDEAGHRAQAKWTEQLLGAGAAWVRAFDCSPGKDLNEYISAAARETEDVS